MIYFLYYIIIFETKFVIDYTYVLWWFAVSDGIARNAAKTNGIRPEEKISTVSRYRNIMTINTVLYVYNIMRIITT